MYVLKELGYILLLIINNLYALNFKKLPSFIGSARNVYQNYLDAMSIVRHFGKPDLFITMNNAILNGQK